MFFRFNTFGLLLIAGSLLALYIMYYSYQRKNNKIYYYLFFFSLCFFIDAFCQGLDCLTTPFWFKSICGQICAPGYLFVAPLWLMLVYTISHNQEDIPKKFKIPLLIISSIFLIIAYSNPWTHLFFSNISLPYSVPYKLQLFYTGTWIYTIVWIYQFLLSLISIFIVIKALIKGSKIYRNSYLIAFISSIVAELVISLSLTDIYPGFSFSVTAYLIVFVFLSFAIFAYDAFNVMNIVNQHAIESVDVGILSFNNKNLLYGLNPASKMIGLTDHDINHDVEDVFNNRMDVLDFYNNNDLNIQNFIFDDLWFEIKKTDIFEEEEYIGKLLTVTNITDKVNRELELEQLSEERKILLHEIHHRVKNNLQLVSSYLSLDSRYYKNNPNYVIAKTQNRLDTMALAHEEVYKSNDVANIPVEPLIVTVVSDLLTKFNAINIKFKYEIDDIFIDIDKAMPLCFLITEITLNVITHAYPNKSEGNFYIDLKSSENSYILKIWDEGKGLPENVNFSSSDSLGFNIIHRLADQLEAELTLLSDVKGFGVKLVFSKD